MTTGAARSFRRMVVLLSARPRANLAVTATTTTTRWFSTMLNQNGMAEFHDRHPQLAREGTVSDSQTPVGAFEASSNDNSAERTTPTGHSLPVSQRSSIDFGESPRVSLLMELKDEVGILHEVLKYFWKYDINVSRIESRPVQASRDRKAQWMLNNHQSNAATPVFDFYLDFHGSLGDPPVQKLMNDLAPLTEKLLVLDEKDVHWFPRHICKTLIALVQRLVPTKSLCC
jgi:hypothetical protein